MSVTHQLALTFISGIGCSLSKQLISYCGSAEKVFQIPKSKLLRIPNIGEVLANQIISQSKEALHKAEKEVLKCEKEGIGLLSYLDKNYPTRLKQLEDAPTVLFYKGKADLNHAKIISIVGTRQATNYGKRVVEEIIDTVKEFNPLIVSGLAYGIDITSHKVSLQNNLPTVAVFACGLDFIYPTAHRPIAEQMIFKGGLLTEYPLQTKPDPHQFPQRNRIIAGLADVTIVVEAGAKGGALITAEIANQYNREVFAVAGNIHSKHSVGCNNLIKEHKANILTSPQDIVTFMNWKERETNQDKIVKKLTIELDAEEQIVYDLLMGHKELHLDELGWQSQLGVSKVATILLNMEFKNLVKALPGKKFALL